jgi:hypothetical protein
MSQIWFLNSSVYISKWLCNNVFILYTFLLKINEISLWIYDLIIPSIAIDRFLFDLMGLRLDSIC